MYVPSGPRLTGFVGLELPDVLALADIVVGRRPPPRHTPRSRMVFRPVERPPGRSSSRCAQGIEAVCRRVFGSGVQVTSAVELDSGMYNNVYRQSLLDGVPAPEHLRDHPPRPGPHSADSWALSPGLYTR